MLNALWVTLLGMLAIFVIQAILYFVILIMKKISPSHKGLQEKR